MTGLLHAQAAYNEQIKDAKERKDDYSLQERRKKKAGAVRNLQQNEAKLKKYEALEKEYIENYERDAGPEQVKEFRELMKTFNRLYFFEDHPLFESVPLIAWPIGSMGIYFVISAQVERPPLSLSWVLGPGGALAPLLAKCYRCHRAHGH